MILEATEENILIAAAAIKNGNLVAFPTETVYGLGANALNETAVKGIFQAKQRPAFNPLIVHLASQEQIPEVADLTKAPHLQELIDKLAVFWPGPLSLVLPKKDCIPLCVTGGLSTVAVRIPDHQVALELIKKSDCPIAAPSANSFSRISPTTAQHVEKNLGGKIDVILDGGPCQVGLESTVVSLTQTPPLLLRPGGVTFEQLKEVLLDLEKYAATKRSVQRTVSPGMLDKHYSPTTPIIMKEDLSEQSFQGKIGLINFSREDKRLATSNYAAVLNLSDKGDPREVAAKLFSALHEMDSMNLDLIVVDSCREEGLGLAVMDRLKRAVFKN